jgi:hypothetical protein
MKLTDSEFTTMKYLDSVPVFLHSFYALPDKLVSESSLDIRVVSLPLEVVQVPAGSLNATVEHEEPSASLESIKMPSNLQ